MRHQLKIILGHFKKTAFTSFLNLLGLTCAFAAFILIMLYVWNEYHFDQFNANADNIYRLEMKSPEGGKSSVYMLGPTGQTLVDEFSDIVQTTTYMPWGKWGEETFSYENSTGVQRCYAEFAYADENLTEVFTFNLRAGKNQPLLDPETAIVTESFAQKIWGGNDPVGKQFKMLGETYTVTAVFQDFPQNSVLTSPVILKIPSRGFIGEARKEWDVTNYPQFIKVLPGTDPVMLNKKINEQSILQPKYRFFDNGKTSATIIARPLNDLRFVSDVAENPLFLSNNKMFVDSLFAVGILILLVAIVNYINFATAILPSRMNSFNINRIIGGDKLNSAGQLILESFSVFIVSFTLAVLLAFALSRQFAEDIIGYQLPINITIIAGCASIALFVALLAGLYPAIISVKGKPILALKKTSTGMSENVRGSLTVFQFAATIVLIVASIAVMKQVSFMQKTDLGFDKSSTLVVPMFDGIRNNLDAFQDEIISSPYIDQVASSRAVPGRACEGKTFTVNGQQCPVWDWAIGDNYIGMMDFDIIKGRDFINGSEADKGNFICNETAAKSYNWTVGTKVGDGQIVGIMKDFNIVSLRQKVDPFVFHKVRYKNELSFVSIKLKGNNVQEALGTVKSAFKLFNPDVPFQSFFLDDKLNMLYSKEDQQASLITFFGLLSVLISILGILGLSIFMCQQKIKEIGIRKVNGAKISEVMLMLNKDFVKWVFISFIIAVPVAWFTMNGWLENFVYKTALSWWIFALAGVLALGIALLTVSWQSWRAATRNPVEALRYE